MELEGDTFEIRYKVRAFNEIGHYHRDGAITKSGLLLETRYIYINIHIKFHLENRPLDRHFGRATVIFGKVARARPSFSLKVHPWSNLIKMIKLILYGKHITLVSKTRFSNLHSYILPSNIFDTRNRTYPYLKLHAASFSTFHKPHFPAYSLKLLETQWSKLKPLAF